MDTQEKLTMLRRTALGSSVALSAAAVAGSVGATPSLEKSAGTPIRLEGTDHIFLVGDDNKLHWVGDTRALAGKHVLWNKEETWQYHPLWRWGFLWVGDPWLSAGLLKDGDPIYLVKWENHWEFPKLLHIQSIEDVELFGINAGNYGRFVLDKPMWESKYGIDADSLVREPLQPATWGRWVPHSDETWPSISLYQELGASGASSSFDRRSFDRNRLTKVLTLRCKRGENLWAAQIYAGQTSSHLRDEELVQVIHYLLENEKTEPVHWRLTSSRSGRITKLFAVWEDTADSRYARRLFDMAQEGGESHLESLTIELLSRVKSTRYHLSMAGMQTAASWLLAECERPL